MVELPTRIVIYGNSGSGKSTMAQAVARELNAPHLDLDTIAWSAPMVRRPVADSIANIHAFVAAQAAWVIEGCYSDLIEAALPFGTELRFLNPGIVSCVRNCRTRPWEAHKYESPEAQNRMLEALLTWVRDYETRDDEFSLARHRAIFERFAGPKREFGDAAITAGRPHSMN